jgi:hypothetical protein
VGSVSIPQTTYKRRNQGHSGRTELLTGKLTDVLSWKLKTEGILSIIKGMSLAKSIERSKGANLDSNANMQ